MKEIELLKIIFKNSPDILEPLNEIDKEIERLKELNDGLTTEIQKELKGKLKLLDEIERLNNIINELEKFLKINSEKDDYDLTEYNKGVNASCIYILEKLQELKENK